MQTKTEKTKNYTLPELPFQASALEPHISKATIDVHYGKHHSGYVKKLNAALEGSKYEDQSLTDLFKIISKLPDAIRNNGGGHYNHSLFWEILSPRTGEPSRLLTDQLMATFGSMENFQKQFADAAKTRFGSGWAWLILDGEGKLAVTSTPNQDNPFMDVAPHQGFPLIGLDVWEHAYYLDYQNNRADYIKAFWNVLDWLQVSTRYDEAVLLLNTTRALS